MEKEERDTKGGWDSILWGWEPCYHIIFANAQVGIVSTVDFKYSLTAQSVMHIHTSKLGCFVGATTLSFLSGYSLFQFLANNVQVTQTFSRAVRLLRLQIHIRSRRSECFRDGRLGGPGRICQNWSSRCFGRRRKKGRSMDSCTMHFRSQIAILYSIWRFLLHNSFPSARIQPTLHSFPTHNLALLAFCRSRTALLPICFHLPSHLSLTHHLPECFTSG